jgi:tetratricopeptide (TPR) repeat protein
MKATIATLVLAGLFLFSSESVEELTQRGDEAYKERYIEKKLREAIGYYERALGFDPKNRYLLNRLSRAYFELGVGYEEGKGKEGAFSKGKDCGFRSLSLDPEFASTFEEKGFKEAIKLQGDIEAVFWTANNWGRWLDFHPWKALMGDLADVRAAFERSLELDEAFLGGGPHRALGSLLAQVPGFLGGDIEKAKEHFKRSIELGPDFLENYVNYAELYAKPKGDWKLFESLLTKVLEADQEIIDKYPFYNRLAVKRAKVLMRSKN